MQKHGIRGWGCFGDGADGTLLDHRPSRIELAAYEIRLNLRRQTRTFANGILPPATGAVSFKRMLTARIMD